MRTFVYVDGFNLYYRALKWRRPDCKWLDIRKLCEHILSPENRVEKINYYTARVSGRRDQDSPNRQRAYIRAIETLDGVKVHYGNFQAKTKRRPLVKPGLIDWLCNRTSVEVHDTEEKGSDVNLASHLVRDACQGLFDVGVVVSGDSDLVEPIRIATQELGRIVGVICPDRHGCSKGMKDAPSFFRYLRSSLERCQLPDSLTGRNGKPILKPQAWRS